jgi:hypothetical protein
VRPDAASGRRGLDRLLVTPQMIKHPGFVGEPTGGPRIAGAKAPPRLDRFESFVVAAVAPPAGGIARAALLPSRRLIVAFGSSQSPQSMGRALAEEVAFDPGDEPRLTLLSATSPKRGGGGVRRAKVTGIDWLSYPILDIAEARRPASFGGARPAGQLRLSNRADCWQSLLLRAPKAEQGHSPPADSTARGPGPTATRLRPGSARK